MNERLYSEECFASAVKGPQSRQHNLADIDSILNVYTCFRPVITLWRNGSGVDLSILGGGG